MKKLFLLATLVVSLCPLNGQQTTGYHRVSQIIARGTAGVTAQVVPYAKISVTNTATGAAATIYSDSDPLLTSPLNPPVITADGSGNYAYYIALNYCVTESISSPGQGFQPIANICQLGGGGGGGTSPGGSNTDVQVNVSGSFGGYSTLTYSPTGGLNVGAVNCAISNCVSIGPLSAPPSPWAFDLTTPATACASIGCSVGIQANGTTVVPSSGVVNFTQGSGVTLTISGNAVQISASASSLSWTSITSGTNPNALLVSGSLGPTGPGTIAATSLTGSILQSQVTGLASTLATYLLSSVAATTYAPLASPTLTGAPKAPTQSCASNTDIATGAYVANCAAPSTQNDVTGSRAFSVVYTNGSTAITVEVTMSTLGASPCTGANTYMNVLVGATSGSLVTIPGNGIWNECQGVAETTFVVPPGYSYEVTWSYLSGPPSSVIIQKWIELPW